MLKLLKIGTPVCVFIAHFMVLLWSGSYFRSNIDITLFIVTCFLYSMNILFYAINRLNIEQYSYIRHSTKGKIRDGLSLLISNTIVFSVFSYYIGKGFVALSVATMAFSCLLIYYIIREYTLVEISISVSRLRKGMGGEVDETI